jgi:hypothetical protein
MRWWIRIGLGLLGGLATAYVGIDSGSKLPTWWPFDSGEFLVPAAIVLGLVSALATLDGLLMRLSSTSVFERSRKAERQLYALHRQLSRVLHPPAKFGSLRTSRRTLNRLGLTVWMVPTWFAIVDALPSPNAVRRWLRGRIHSPSMRRVAAVRFIDETTPSGIHWRRGVGVIGQAWLTGDEVHLDMAHDWPDRVLPISDWVTAWEAMDERLRLGLSAKEARKLQANYDAALALPIYMRRKSDDERWLAGVLTVDVPVDTPDLSLDRRELRKQLKVASNRVAEQL